MEEKGILLVEDNPNDVVLTERALKKASIASKLVVAEDGVEALDYLFGTGAHSGRDLNVQPLVVLLDLKLPRLDGLEVLRRVRGNERTKLLPVVVLTSSREQEDIVCSYSLGANSYIRKPVSFTEFTEVVRQLGIYWLTLNEAPSTLLQGS